MPYETTLTSIRLDAEMKLNIEAVQAQYGLSGRTETIRFCLALVANAQTYLVQDDSQAEYDDDAE